MYYFRLDFPTCLIIGIVGEQVKRVEQCQLYDKIRDYICYQRV